MNPKLFLHLITSKRADQGFTLPLVLGIGMIMLLAGTVMMLRSQSNQQQASAKQSSAEGISAAEVGVARFQDLINNNRYLALYPDCVSGRDTSGVCPDSGTSQLSWANASNVPKIALCDATTSDEISDTAIDQGWVAVDSSQPDKGEYRLVSYQFKGSKPNTAPGNGTLIVEGRVKASNVNREGSSRISVQIPVQPGPIPMASVPGVWLADDQDNNATEGNTIQGDVLIGDCETPLTGIKVTGTDPLTNEPYKAMHTGMTYPPLPPIPTTAINLGTITKTNITLPRSTDSPVTETINGKDSSIYQYVADQIDLQSGSNVLTITPGQRVRIYLKGNIEKGGEIQHSCIDASNNAIAGCKPTDFQVYGYGDYNSYICTIGNKRVEAFIFAPKYTVGTAGTGGGDGGIKGTVWAYDWSNGKGCGSNTNNTAVVQTARWDEIGLQPEQTPPRISALTGWERQSR